MGRRRPIILVNAMTTMSLMLVFVFGCKPEDAASELDTSNGIGADKYFSTDPAAEMAERERLRQLQDAEANTEIEEDSPVVFIEINADDLTIPAGASEELRLTVVHANGTRKSREEEAIWVSSDPETASFDDTLQPYLMRGRKLGAVEVSTSLMGFSARKKLTVVEAEFLRFEVNPKKANVGSTQRFRLNAIYSDGSSIDVANNAHWQSSNNTIAKIDNTRDSAGYFDMLAAGNVSITATYEGVSTTQLAQVELREIESIDITTESGVTVLNVGTTAQLRATAHYKTGGEGDVTSSIGWSSSNPSIATVDDSLESKGVVSPVSGGYVTISGSFSGVVGSIELTIMQDTFQSYEIRPSGQRVPQGLSVDFKLIGIRADESEQDLTDNAFWHSSADLLGPVSNDPGQIGRVTAMSPGTTTLTATYGMDVTTLDVELVEPAVVSIVVDANKTALACGSSQPNYTATGILSDETEIDLTEQVTWSILNSNIATISNASGSKGQVTTLMQGNTTVRATMEVAVTGLTVSGTKGLVVAEPALLSLDIEVPTVSYPGGSVFNAKAKGVFACEVASPVYFTEAATWSSGDPATVLPSNGSGTKGRCTTTGDFASDRVVRVTATKDSATGYKDVTIRPREAVSLVLNFLGDTKDIGETTTAKIQVTFTDQTTLDMSNIASFPAYSLVYTAGNTTNASVNAAGIVTALNEGGSQITAQLTTPQNTVISGARWFNTRSPCKNGIRANTNYCWFLSALDQSCQEVCTATSGTYHDGTATWAGSAADNSNWTTPQQKCDNVLQNLGQGTLSSAHDAQAAPDSQGLGCGVLEVEGFTVSKRYSSPATTASAKHPYVKRACACRDPIFN
jgi:hypothetical protein